MALEELDGLFADVVEADRATIKAILERNQKAADRLTQRETVYTAFVDGDTARLAAITAPVVATTTTTTPAAVDMDALNRSLDERVGRIFEDPRFNTAVEARAKTLAEQIAKESENRAVGRAAYLSDEIFSLRTRHREQYGKELDTKAVEEFMKANPGKFASLTATYEAFTEADRIQKIKDEAFKAGQAARATSEVPGVSQPGAGTPAGMFIKSNPMNTSAQGARGDALDAAAAAFRHLSAQRVQ